MTDQTYILLDSKNEPLAKGIMLSPPGAETIRVRVLEDKAEAVARHEVIQLVGIGRGTVSLRCRLTQQGRDQLTLERMESLNPELRQTLRIPTSFESFLYPLSGGWKGRRPIRAIDLSCGGLAFYGARGLEVGETAEVVLPITSAPLIVRIQVLKMQELKNERTYYAAKFVDICPDEEDMICEAVFSIELENHGRAAREERTD